MFYCSTKNSQFVRKAGSSQNRAHPIFGRALLTVQVVLSKDSRGERGGGTLDLMFF